jgi:hypothetical protein
MIWYVEENKTELSYGNTIPRNFAVWYVEENFKSMNCNAAPMWRFLCAKQWKKCSSVGGRKKKIGVDWPRLNRFRKNFSNSQCQIEKIGVDRSRESQKRPLQWQVSLNFFTTGHSGVAESFCTSMACPWQEVQYLLHPSRLRFRWHSVSWRIKDALAS